MPIKSSNKFLESGQVNSYGLYRKQCESNLVRVDPFLNSRMVRIWYHGYIRSYPSNLVITNHSLMITPLLL